MKWEIVTTNKKHVVRANNSASAVDKIRETDAGDIKSCKVVPHTINGKMKKLWRDLFGK